ncbi:MAG: flagellar filament capping protein FliD, partial [Desulfatiglandales bacterium]
YGSGTGTYSATVRFKSGALVELGGSLKDFISSSKGPINLLVENYEDIVENIEEKIEREEARLAKYESMLKERYSRLESVLSEMNETLNYLNRLSLNKNQNSS